MIGTTKYWGAAVAFALAALFAVPASAQATRTWVSGVGDDANPCSRTAPCKTWPGAISKTAAGGEIDALDPGGFGALTITKAITIDGGGGIGGQVASVLVAGTNGININAPAGSRVKIRNLTLQGLAQGTTPGLSGIKFNTGAALVIEHVGIIGFGGSSSLNAGVDFEPSGISSLSMLDVETQFNLGDGVLIKPTATGTATATLNNVSAMNNVGSGLKVDGANSAASDVTVVNSSFAGNADGITDSAKVGALPAHIEMTGSSVTENVTAGISSNGVNANVSIGGDTISGNPTGLAEANSGKISSFGDNYIFGNTTNGAPNGTALTKS